MARNITSLYGSSCANNGKDALNTPSFSSPVLTLCPVPHFLPLQMGRILCSTAFTAAYIDEIMMAVGRRGRSRKTPRPASPAAAARRGTPPRVGAGV
eukprot:2646087-Pyramimonas_sp.AAC.1